MILNLKETPNQIRNRFLLKINSLSRRKNQSQNKRKTSPKRKNSDRNQNKRKKTKKKNKNSRKQYKEMQVRQLIINHLIERQAE